MNAMSEIPYVQLNGSKTHRYLGCLNYSFACIEGESMIGAIKILQYHLVQLVLLHHWKDHMY